MTRPFKPKNRDDNKKVDPYYHYFRWVVCNNLRLDAAKGRWPEIKDPSLICYNNIFNAHVISVSVARMHGEYIESLEIFTRWNENTDNSRVWCRIRLDTFSQDDIRAKIETIHWDKLKQLDAIMKLHNIPTDPNHKDDYYIETSCLEDNESVFRQFMDLCISVLLKKSFMDKHKRLDLHN